MSLEERWVDILADLRQQGRYRAFKLPDGLDFTSNDYLGYGAGRCPIAVGASAITGTSSRLLRGHRAIWDEVEALLCSWHGSEAALMMSSGYAANEGLIATLAEPGDWVAADELSHACIIDGLRLARPRKFLFGHNDLDHLDEGLKAEAAKRPVGRELFVVTESLFSMDGDRAPLPEIVALAERYGARVIVDEAHSTGCYGAAGSGIVDELGLRDRVLATVHTGGKALGVCGAYVCGSALLKELLINRCRHLIFTTALPPALGEWWRDRIPSVQRDRMGREQLAALARSFREDLAARGIVAAGSEYIVPVIVGADDAAVRAAATIAAQGFDVRAIRPPSVPQGSARLRISIHADHLPADLSRLAEAVAGAVR